jgi:integrase
MPARQRGEPYKLGKGRWGLRYYDESGRRRRQSGFTSRTEALDWFETVERKRQLGLPVAAPDTTFGQFVDRYLRAHGATRSPRTITILRERLGYALACWADTPLAQLSPGEIADWQATLPERSRYGIVQALRQALQAAVRWEAIVQNPAKLAGPNPQPRREEITPFTVEEVEQLRIELGPWGSLVVFAAETGLRPAELIALEWRDVSRRDGVLVVERSYAYGRLSPYGKTVASRRRVPLSSRALAALEGRPRRLDTRLVFPGEKGGFLNLHNWRAREWHPALEAAGLRRRRPYDLRHTAISNWLAAGLSLFEVARYAGTSVQMIDRVYGHLTRGSEERARSLLDAHASRLGQEWAMAGRVEHAD